ncbi:hypothetical protein MUO14_17020 [Halobacillus shinanisalinarum]|uniref:Core-binding (CB) domain-containing protein n=1 Tax=Halobacillus shinanisalinarum TaxID=2932258 RepID=A0ABY4GVU9_9BACI|nr:hypothetical protein [Halobacillus shinanisalinarum]UOQ92179.1 hypothetical protein MUO14_17020 [Halobacillus shinanisalinarum]
MNKNLMDETYREYNIDKYLTGYWSRDVWNLDDCPLAKGQSFSFTTKNLRFDYIHNPHLKNEFKFFIYKGLVDKRFSFKTVWSFNAGKLKALSEYISKQHPSMHSIIEIPKQAFLPEFKNYLEGKGIVTIRKQGTSEPWRTKKYERKSLYLKLYERVYNFFYDFYDDRKETEKDRWDARKLGVRYNITRSHYSIDFSDIPISFRPLVKRYFKHRLCEQMSITLGTAVSNLSKLYLFFNFISNKYPDWVDLNQLRRIDIEEFIMLVKNTPLRGKGKSKAPTNQYIGRTLSNLNTFLTEMQIFEWKEAPMKPVKVLILPGIILGKNPKNPIKLNMCQMKYGNKLCITSINFKNNLFLYF